MNERFAGTVRELAAPGDVIWVNDFHLCLVPAYLRAAGSPGRIGLFWHIPFPPPEVFGICQWREELLLGLLGADVLGFQTDDDARNFADCVRRFLDVPVRGLPLRGPPARPLGAGGRPRHRDRRGRRSPRRRAIPRCVSTPARCAPAWAPTSS